MTSIEDPKIFESTDRMLKMNSYTSLMASHLASKHLMEMVL